MALLSRTRPSLAGRVVLITGGARGIGRATAAALVAEQAKVAIGDVDLAVAKATAAELTAEGGGPCEAFALDVTDEQSFRRFVSAAEASLGSVDVLINNAGIMPVADFLDHDSAIDHRQIEINLHGVITGMRAVLPSMIERHAGHVVNIASAAGRVGYPGIAVYSATKHAVLGLSEAVRSELRLQQAGVDVSVVCPVLVSTELTSGVKGPKLFPLIKAEDVADAIVDAIKTKRYFNYVPRSTGVISHIVGAVLPRRGLDAFNAVFKIDQIFYTMDTIARAAYEQRIRDAQARGAEDHEQAAAAAK